MVEVVGGLDRVRRRKYCLGLNILGGVEDLWRHGNSRATSRSLEYRDRWLADEGRGNQCLGWINRHRFGNLEGGINGGRFDDFIVLDCRGINLKLELRLLNGRRVWGRRRRCFRLGRNSIGEHEHGTSGGVSL